MKYMVRAGWEDVYFENDNKDFQYAVVVWSNGNRFVLPYEEEAQAKRALNYQLKKYDRKCLPAKGQVFLVWAV